jgi:hypothetical protein
MDAPGNYVPNSTPEPYFRRDEQTGVTTLHPFAHSPFRDPRVSSVTVENGPLRRWEVRWSDHHEYHLRDELEDLETLKTRKELDPDMDEDEARELDQEIADLVTTIKAHYEPDDGGAQWIDDDDELAVYPLVKCCGTRVPENKQEGPLVVRASGDFVTIHDYVTEVHPWPMSRREDILRATAIADEGKGNPLPPDSKLMAFMADPEEIGTREWEYWVKAQMDRWR